MFNLTLQLLIGNIKNNEFEMVDSYDLDLTNNVDNVFDLLNESHDVSYAEIRMLFSLPNSIEDKSLLICSFKKMRPKNKLAHWSLCQNIKIEEPNSKWNLNRALHFMSQTGHDHIKDGLIAEGRQLIYLTLYETESCSTKELFCKAFKDICSWSQKDLDLFIKANKIDNWD